MIKEIAPPNTNLIDYREYYNISVDNDFCYLGELSEAEKSWFYKIRGEHGSISNFGANMLCVEITDIAVMKKAFNDFKGILKKYVFHGFNFTSIFIFENKDIHEVAMLINAEKCLCCN